MSMNDTAQFEFEDEPTRGLKDYVNVFRRRKITIAYSAIAILILTTLAAVLWPPTYKSESIILIEQQEIPADLVRSTITSYAQQRIEQIKQRIMTIGNIMTIVDEFALYDESERERKTRTEMAQEFRSAVTIRPISAEVVDPRSGRPSSAVIAFSLAYRGDSAAKVQKVTSEITELYLEENLKERREESTSTSEFLESEADQLKNELEKLDEKIAAFKELNAGSLPEQKQFNQGVVDRSERTIDGLTFQLSELQKRKIELESDLAQLSPNAPVVLATGQTVLGDADRLKSLQTQLSYLEARYSDDHPSVIRQRREVQELLDKNISFNEKEERLKQLRLEKDRLAALKERYTGDHPKIVQSQNIIRSLESTLATASSQTFEEKPDNPAYLVVLNRLRATEEDIRTYTAQIAESRKALAEHEQLLSRTPQIEKELQDLARDYRSTNLRYQEIHSKLLSAELARNLETEQRGERFTLIQPPELPVDPVSPNRPAIAIFGLILALGSGLGIAMLREVLDEAVYGVNDVVLATGSAPLVVVGYMENHQERKKHNLKRVYWVLGIILAGIVAVVCFHFFIKPLDVTWFILMRRLGF